MSNELKKAEQIAHAYDGLGTPMSSYRPHVAEMRRQVLGPDFNGRVQPIPDRFSCEPVPPDLTRDLEPLACPICGVRLFHVKSPAQSFQPPRTYHEWHHVEDDGCWLRARIGQVVLTTTDDGAEQAETIAAWNRRSLSEPAAPAGAEVVMLVAMSIESARQKAACFADKNSTFAAIEQELREASALLGPKTFIDDKVVFHATPQPVEPPDDTLNDIAAGNEAARDDEWGEAGEEEEAP